MLITEQPDVSGTGRVHTRLHAARTPYIRSSSNCLDPALANSGISADLSSPYQPTAAAYSRLVPFLSLTRLSLYLLMKYTCPARTSLFLHRLLASSCLALFLVSYVSPLTLLLVMMP